MASKDKIFTRLEVFTVTAMQALLSLVVVLGTLVLYLLLVKNLIIQLVKIESTVDFTPAMQQTFAGVLTVVLGLELLETLKSFFTEHHLRLEVILVIAIIAVGRHVIQIDVLHTPGPVLLGLAALILALTVGYFLTKQAQIRITPANLLSRSDAENAVAGPRRGLPSLTFGE